MRKKIGDKEISLFKKALDKLNNGEDLNSFFDFDNKKILKEIGLISIKPYIIVCNVDEESVKNGNDHTNLLKKNTKKKKL